MPLDKDLIGGRMIRLSAKEMIEADFVQGGSSSEGGDMPADPGAFPVGTDHHCHRIPANKTLDSAFHGPIARVLRLGVRRNRVDIRRHGGAGNRDPPDEGILPERLQ